MVFLSVMQTHVCPVSTSARSLEPCVSTRGKGMGEEEEEEEAWRGGGGGMV